jgi:hypothetical protein
MTLQSQRLEGRLQSKSRTNPLLQMELGLEKEPRFRQPRRRIPFLGHQCHPPRHQMCPLPASRSCCDKAAGPHASTSTVPVKPSAARKRTLAQTRPCGRVGPLQPPEAFRPPDLAAARLASGEVSVPIETFGINVPQSSRNRNKHLILSLTCQPLERLQNLNRGHVEAGSLRLPTRCQALIAVVGMRI